MAFVLSQSPSYNWPVPVQFPIDGGRFDKQIFDAQFKRLPQDRIREIHDLITTGDIDDDSLCKEILVGWAGITDDKGAEIPYSEKTRDKLLLVPLVAAAIVNAWFDSLGKAKRKN